MSVFENIKVLRLSSGEEIIAEVEHDVIHSKYRVMNPCQIVIIQPEKGVPHAEITLMPWLAYTEAKKELDIDANYVMFALKPALELVNQYNKIYGSGLTLPNIPLMG